MSLDISQQPILSALIPSHNGERWLAQTLQSVADQTCAAVEVVLVDSSDDASLEIARRFSDRLPIRILHRPDLIPWTAKTNLAARVATADWVCILHQDDVWLPERTARLSDWLTDERGAVMHLHPVDIIDSAGVRRGRWRCPLPEGSTPVPRELFRQKLLVQNFVGIPAPTIRRDAFLAVGGLDEKLWYTADWDLYLKLSGLGDIYYHSDCLACFRIYGGSLTMSGSRDLDDFRDQMETVLARHIGCVAARPRETLRLAAVSIDINVGLAAASRRRPIPLIRAVLRLIALGPRGVQRYLNYSRIFERALSRVRARLAKAL